VSHIIDLSKTPIQKMGAEIDKACEEILADVMVTLPRKLVQELLRRANVGGNPVVKSAPRVGRRATADEVRAAILHFYNSEIPAIDLPERARKKLSRKGIRCSIFEAREMLAEIMRERIAQDPPPPVLCAECSEKVVRSLVVGDGGLTFCSDRCKDKYFTDKKSVEQLLQPPPEPTSEAVTSEVKGPEELEQTMAARYQEMVAAFEKDPCLTMSVKDCIRYVILKADGLDEMGLKKALQIDSHELNGLKRSLDRFATAYRLQEDGDLRKYLLDLLKQELPSKGVAT
jgi:hypothetical protein